MANKYRWAERKGDGIPEERELEFWCCFSISGWIPMLMQVLVISLTFLEGGLLRWEDCFIFYINPPASP